MNNFSSLINYFTQISLRLKGFKALESMANGLLNGIELYSLDLSENQMNMEQYLDK